MAISFLVLFRARDAGENFTLHAQHLFSTTTQSMHTAWFSPLPGESYRARSVIANLFHVFSSLLFHPETCNVLLLNGLHYFLSITVFFPLFLTSSPSQNSHLINLYFETVNWIDSGTRAPGYESTF